MNAQTIPLKILHILDHSLPLHSGYAFRSLNICRGQLKRGWQPVMLTSPKHEESWNGPSEKEETIDGLHYYRTGAVPRSAWPLVTELRLVAATARRIYDIIEVERPDILHAHSPVLNAIPALWVGRRQGIPVVYEMRALWEDAAVDHGTYGPGSWKYKLVRFLETWVCRTAGRVTVICHGLEKDLVKRGIVPGKITVVPNGVDVDDFKDGPANDSHAEKWHLEGKRVIGFIGSFYRYEGLDLLVEAVAHLVRTRSDIVLLLTGGGETEADLKAQIKRLHLEEHVIMPGRISHDAVPGVYALVDILAYPRYPMRLTELVTPLKPLEAMAMGKAIVASDIGGHRELVQHLGNGLLFKGGSVRALVESLERLLDDDELRQALGKRAAALARQKYSWDMTLSGYVGLYSDLLGRPSIRNESEGLGARQPAKPVR